MADDLEPEDRALIARLRGLPPEGNEPDWDQLEAAIRARVGDRAPRPWWRNWRWIVPIWTCATTAVVALLVLHGKSEPREVNTVFESRPPITTLDRAPSPSMWLDGEPFDLEDVDMPALDDLDRDARAALQPDDGVTGGILPVADYGWVDSLDEEEVQRADAWLKRNHS
jgi:hypothetical protein